MEQCQINNHKSQKVICFDQAKYFQSQSTGYLREYQVRQMTYSFKPNCSRNRDDASSSPLSNTYSMISPAVDILCKEETPSSNLVPIYMSSSKCMIDAIQLMPLVTPVYQPLHDHCFLSRCYYLFSSSDFTSLPLGGNIRDHNNLSQKTKKLGGLVSMRKHIFGYQYLKQIISTISNDKPGVFCICTLLGSIPRKKSFIHRQKVTPWKLRLLILVASTFR